MENEAKQSKLSIFGKVIPFITLEIFALLAFNLGNSFLFFTIIIGVLAILSIIFTVKQYNTDKLTTFAFFLFPVFLYGLLTALSYFNQDTNYNLSGPLTYLVPIALVLIAMCGYSLSLLKEFKLKYALITIYSAIAVLVALNLLVTMIEFAPFHTLIYKGQYIYYNGAPSRIPVSEIAFSLVGFEFKEVSVRYFSLGPTMLLTAFVPLFFMNRKEEKKLFYIYLAFGILGCISLLFTLSLFTIITDVLAAIVIAFIILCAKGKIKAKTVYIILIVLAVLFAIAFVILFIAAQSNPTGIVLQIQNALKANSLINRLLFTNKYIKPYRTVLDGILNSYKAFGSPTYSTYDFLAGIKPTGSWLFDNIFTSGIFGALFFFAGVVIGVRRLIKYYKTANDNKVEKLMVVSFVLMFLTYTAVNYDVINPALSETLSPVYESGLFLIVIFFMSYAFSKSLEVEVKAKKEEKKEEERQNEEITL